MPKTKKKISNIPADLPSYDKKLRTCLGNSAKCKKSFLSQGPWQRFCGKCRESIRERSGSTAGSKFFRTRSHCGRQHVGGLGYISLVKVR